MNRLLATCTIVCIKSQEKCKADWRIIITKTRGTRHLSDYVALLDWKIILDRYIRDFVRWLQRTGLSRSNGRKVTYDRILSSARTAYFQTCTVNNSLLYVLRSCGSRSTCDYITRMMSHVRNMHQWRTKPATDEWINRSSRSSYPRIRSFLIP